MDLHIFCGEPCIVRGVLEQIRLLVWVTSLHLTSRHFIISFTSGDLSLSTLAPSPPVPISVFVSQFLFYVPLRPSLLTPLIYSYSMFFQSFLCIVVMASIVFSQLVPIGPHTVQELDLNAYSGR
jgi:hypothetical protein